MVDSSVRNSIESNITKYRELLGEASKIYNQTHDMIDNNRNSFSGSDSELIKQFNTITTDFTSKANTVNLP